MRPQNLETKIFLDSGDPNETRAALDLLGFLDGQTTNPTLIAKNPSAQERIKAGNKFTSEEIFSFYKNVVSEISTLIPEGSVSIEVYADAQTKSETLWKQAQEMNAWIKNAHIKLPITSEGLKTAELCTAQGIHVNLTLCFNQMQAAAVFAATRGAQKGDVFVSPFIGRLDAIGVNGMDLINNISKMFLESDHHVEVLAASTRTMDHFLLCLENNVDIITAPFSLLKQWAEAGMPLSGGTPSTTLSPLTFETVDLTQTFGSYNISHELTDKGLAKFCADWNALIQ